MRKIMNLNQIREKYQYTDKDGVTRDRTLNIPHYFKEIPFIYSPHLEKGRVKFSASMQKLYCYIADWEKSGGVCYEEQSELAEVCRLSRPKTNDLIEQMELIGLITRTKIPGRRNKELRALPLTDAHITAPEELETQQEAPQQVSEPEANNVSGEEEKAPESVTAPPEPLVQGYQMPAPASDEITDEIKIEAVCELLSRPDSLRQQCRGDSFVNYARRVLQRNHKKLPSRLEERLEMRFENLFPLFYSRFELPF